MKNNDQANKPNENRHGSEAPDNAWKMFLVCEDRQKSAIQSRNNVSGFLAVGAGAVFAIITRGQTGNFGYVVGVALAFIGVIGILSYIFHENDILKWMRNGRNILEELDRINGTRYSKNYARDDEVKVKNFAETYTALLLSTHGAYLWMFSALLIGGIGIYFYSWLYAPA